MSDYSDFGSDDVKATVINHQDRDDVCRDFLRNTCRRGRRCKYRHPPSIAPGPPPITNGDSDTMGASSKPQPTFCHDFQNTGCHRPTCKFLHCTREEEEHFHQTGQLPHRLQPNIDVPLCRDFMKGECKRGAKCKYRHLTTDFHDCDLLQRNDIGSGRADLPHHDLRPHPNDMRNNQNHNHNHNHNHGFNHMEDSFEKYDRYEYSHGGPGPGLDGPQLKRRRVEVDGYGGGAAGNIDGRFGPGLASSGRPNSYQYQVLEEENVALRRRVEELKKQVADLTATNEVLLEQNARLRVSKSATVSAVQMQASQALAPAVTLSLAGMAQPPNLQAPTLAAPLNTSLTQQIALNSDMATQHALHSAAQRMAREIHQQQQQQHQQQQQQQQQQQAVAAAAVTVPPPRPPQGAPQPPPLGLPPLTLNPTVSMNPPLASLALPQNNLVAVSLPSLVTPSSLQQVAPPGCSMAQTLGPPSNPLVSYPIMSQDMRSVMAPSSLAH